MPCQPEKYSKQCSYYDQIGNEQTLVIAFVNGAVVGGCLRQQINHGQSNHAQYRDPASRRPAQGARVLPKAFECGNHGNWRTQ